MKKENESVIYCSGNEIFLSQVTSEGLPISRDAKKTKLSHKTLNT